MLGAFFDLSISKTLYNPLSNWAQLMANWGQLPGLLLGLIVHAHLSFSEPNPHLRNLFSLIGLASTGVIAYVGLKNFGHPSWSLSILLGSVLFSILYVLYQRRSKAYLNRDHSWMLFLSLSYVGSIVLTQGLKSLWSRPRFTLVMSDLQGFSAWFKPVWFTLQDAWMSFPSGHAAMAALLVALTYHKRFNHWAIKLGLYGFIGLMMLSRVILGKHYISDVFAGVFITLIWMEWLYPKIRSTSKQDS